MTTEKYFESLPKNLYSIPFLSLILKTSTSSPKVLIALFFWNHRNFETEGGTPKKHEIKSLRLQEIYQHDSSWFVDHFPVQSYRVFKKLERSILLIFLVGPFKTFFVFFLNQFKVSSSFLRISPEGRSVSLLRFIGQSFPQETWKWQQCHPNFPTRRK